MLKTNLDPTCIDHDSCKKCFFEWVYFSKAGSNILGRGVYSVREELGFYIAERVIEILGRDFDGWFHAPIPNTARPMCYGAQERYSKLEHPPKLKEALEKWFKERLFITEEGARIGERHFDGLEEVIHNMSALLDDDSIVRGDTLFRQILPILIENGVVDICIASSAPELRFPCCYGIDHSMFNHLIAFKAMEDCTKDLPDGQDIWTNTCREALSLQNLPNPANIVQNLYTLINTMDPNAISRRIAQRLTPQGYKGNLVIVYNTIENVQKAIGLADQLCLACLDGDYPTSGGNRFCVRSFVNYVENKHFREYDIRLTT